MRSNRMYIVILFISIENAPQIGRIFLRPKIYPMRRYQLVRYRYSKMHAMLSDWGSGNISDSWGRAGIQVCRILSTGVKNCQRAYMDSGAGFPCSRQPVSETRRPLYVLAPSQPFPHFLRRHGTGLQ
jgi:hypothetical protein